jgi:uncharacterized protein
MVDYRIGMDMETGQALIGFAHVQQSVRIILTTFYDEMVMLHEFGSNLVRQIGRNLTPPVIAALYRDAVTAIHAFEPEYRIKRIRIPQITRIGGITIETQGLYYPEGRNQNYALVETANASFALTGRSSLGRPI